MCSEAWDSTTATPIGTLGEMRRWLGSEPAWHPDCAPTPGSAGNGDEYCLCGVDFPACAAMRGMNAEFDGIAWTLAAAPPA